MQESVRARNLQTHSSRNR